jgi:predicted RNA polymerase sigma factor
MKYIALLYGEPDVAPAPGTPEFMQMLGEFQSATTAMADAGILVDSSPLQPPQTATTVRAALLARCGRREDAVAAYCDALALEPADAVRQHITSQITALAAAPARAEET